MTQSVWWDGKSQYFEILKEFHFNGKTWVNYQNAKTKETYCCYKEAFINRFTEITNVKTYRRITRGY